MKELEASFKPDPTCPLITPYTQFLGVPEEGLRRLYAIRRAAPGSPVDLPPMPRLREVIEDTGQPLLLRNYQKGMVAHLATMPRFINGDGVGLGKTLCAVAAACAIDHQLGGQRVKVVVLTTNATAYQWETEIKRFSTLNPWVLRDAYKFKGDRKTTYGHEARMIQLRKFLEHPKLDVCICRYSQWMGRRRAAAGALDRDGRPVNADTGKELISEEAREFRDAFSGMKDRLVLVLDETHKIKSPDGLLRNIILSVQRKFQWVWGLTATAIKNNLEEFYAIFSALGVSPLGSLPHFRENFCIWQAMNFAGRTEYKVVGYTKLPEFKVGMRPWFWGRSQSQVGEPLPKLTTLYHPVELSKEQAKLLLEDIPSGAYVLPPAMKLVAGEIEMVERDPSNLMTALSVMSAVTNSPALLDVHDPKTFLAHKLSPKEELLLDLLDGDYQGESIICFTKYRSWIDRLQHLTEKRKFTARPFLRITGAEKGATRERNRKLFQAPDNDYTFIAINTAGIEGVNLQQAAHLIALDLPWSWGDLIQLVGRMVRMASPHSACTFHIFYGLGTIDEYVIETQRGKKGVFERILGSAGTAGLLDAEDLSQDLENAALGLENESDDNFKDMLRAHAKKIGIRPFVFGEQLAFRQMLKGKPLASDLKGPRQVVEQDLDALW